MRSKLGCLVFAGGLFAIVGLAGAQQASDTAPSPATAQAPATAPAPAGPSAETIKRARDGGLKPEVRKGVTVFCWEDADIGTRFKTKKCVNEDMLAQILEMRQLQRDQMQRGGGCNGGACGGMK